MLCRVFVVVLAFSTLLGAEENTRDFAFKEPGEVMIAQESRHYQTFVKPPVRIIKPRGVTNSHRPQYDLDSFEDDIIEEFPTTKRYDFKAHKMVKEGMIKDAVLRALERKDHVGKFAQLIPIIRAMSGQQRVALASLVTSQVSTPPGRSPLNLAQVRSMFGNSQNSTADLMLPILLDMANLIRRAVRPGKEIREVIQPLHQPHPQLLRRSFTEDTYLDDEPFDTGFEIETTKAPRPTRPSITRRTRPIRTNNRTEQNTEHKEQITDTNIQVNTVNNDKNTVERNDDKNKTTSSTTTTTPSSTPRARFANSLKPVETSTSDLTADATNQTLASDLPVAEKLRAYNRYVDRKGNLIRRGNYPPKPSPAHRTTAEPTISLAIRRRPMPARKLPAQVADQGNCELFTNTLCLHSEDYPTEAIVQSIRRNKAAAGALLADFKDPGEGAFDGVTAAEEAKYTAAAATRRGDTRDFAAAGEAGFMCPSTVKYARPQRARATSGQWKYIVNTGEHTQTLRLEKCLKPKEPCTFLTDNFKSKCVQVYNYHRLLTWDQQNGLHMDIFKVPTCCSCHIEGYSVSFPPLGHRNHETSHEHFPGEDLSAEHGNGAFEQVQQSVHRPTKTPPFLLKKPLEFSSSFAENHNLLQGTPFQSPTVNDNDEYISNGNGNQQLSNPMDSYGNTYFSDSFNQATSVRNVKRPLRNPPSISNGFETVTLPSYLEPPTPSATSTFLTKETSKFKKQGQFKRGPSRPRRRPIRKKIGGPDDLMSSGTTSVDNIDSLEDFNDDLDQEDIHKININNNSPKHGTIAPKLPAVTTEMPSTSPRNDQNRVKEIVTVHGERINYNYHPIIDFFNADDKNDNDSIDREDSVPFASPLDSEWKPINNPPTRNTPTSITLSNQRKKHK